jgi:hypothetical protein
MIGGDGAVFWTFCEMADRDDFACRNSALERKQGTESRLQSGGSLDMEIALDASVFA